MLNTAVQFIQDQLNSFVITQTGSTSLVAKMSKVVDDAGKYAIDDGAVGVTILNIEEDRVFKSQLPEFATINGQHVVLEPDIKLNLCILFAANFKLYDMALKYISYVLTFFQSHSVFTSEQYPALDPQIKKLTVELQSLTYEQLNQVWAFIGGKQLPSVIYKVRMVALQDKALTRVQPPITTISSTLYSK